MEGRLGGGRLVGRLDDGHAFVQDYLIAYFINVADGCRLTYGWELIDGNSALGMRRVAMPTA